MSEMLANNLTLDDEEAVQEELRAMQKDIMKETLPIELPAVPIAQPITSVEQGIPVFVVAEVL
jgi:charged multivesicular body protein 6